MATVCGVGLALPPNYYDQETLIAALRPHWGTRHFNLDRLEALHRNALVGGRHLALPMEAYAAMGSFRARNDAFIEVALGLGQRAIEAALAQAGLQTTDVDHLMSVSVTGVATPSIDARLVNRMKLRPDVKRTPIFGLGCVAGAAGVARLADVLRGDPDGVAVLLSVELCSLTIQREDLSMTNIIASGLFGDGAAAVVMTGANRSGAGPHVMATRSVFYPDTERMMGWDITDTGFKVVLSPEVPALIESRIGADVAAFLADEGVSREQIQSWVCHPGGPKILEAMTRSLSLGPDALKVTWDSLAQVGNLSSASVLAVLKGTRDERRPPPGSLGLLMAMGPGFCSELVLLRW